MGKVKTFFSNNGKKLAVSFAKILIVCIIITAICLSIYSITAYANLRITVDLNTTYQTVEGFGASSAWSFQTLGKEAPEEVSDEAIEMLYGDSGLELNIYRFNIGGGSADPALDNVAPYNNDWFIQERRAESFFIAENYVDVNSFYDESNYDFENRDKDALYMFEKALATGNVEKVVFFANSPHYKMTVSGTCAGAEVQQNNLKEECYDAFSEYILIIVENLVEKYLSDLPVMPEVIISPVNEPQWDWGGSGASQEGCHFDPEPLAKFYDVFFNKLDEYNAQNNTDYQCDIFESGNYKFYWDRDDIRDYLEEMSKYDYFDTLTHISAHSYGANDSKSVRENYQKYLQKNFPQLNLSMTEFCEMEGGRDTSIDSGLFLGRVMSRDFSMLNAIDWSWWLAVSSYDYNDGLVYWDKNNSPQLSVLKRYYVMGQFSKFIDNGDVRAEARCSDLTGWANLDYCVFKKADGDVVLIVINSSNSKKDLSVYGLSEYSSYTMTYTTKQENWAEKSGEWNEKITLEAKSIATFVLSK